MIYIQLISLLYVVQQKFTLIVSYSGGLGFACCFHIGVHNTRFIFFVSLKGFIKMLKEVTYCYESNVVQQLA